MLIDARALELAQGIEAILAEVAPAESRARSSRS